MDDNKNSLILESLAGNRKEISSLSAFIRYLEEHMKKEFSSYRGASNKFFTIYGKRLMGDKLFRIDFNKNYYEVYFNPSRVSIIVDVKKHSSFDFDLSITDDMKKLFFRTEKLDAGNYLTPSELKDILVFKINFNTGKASLYGFAYNRVGKVNKVSEKYSGVYNLSGYYKEFASKLWERGISTFFDEILFRYSLNILKELKERGFRSTFHDIIICVK